MEKKYYVGIDLGGTSIKLGIIDVAGNIIAKEESPTPHHKYQETLQLFVEMINRTGIPIKEIAGIGIGVPGFVDTKQGLVHELVNVGWKNAYLKNDLEEILNIPVFVDNDANLAALGEVWQGAGKGAKNLLLITIGTGIGAGVIVDGQIYHGNSDMAGEIGHLTVKPTNGKQCNCGKLGCLETEASATAILNYVNDEINKGSMTVVNNQPTVKDIFVASSKGDLIATKAIENASYYLGLALSQISHVIAPDMILIGGGVSQAGDQILNPIINNFKQFSLPRITEQTKIEIATLQNDAGIIGAAYNAIINTKQ